MDFVSDGLSDGRRIRCLAIVDDFSRECLVLEVDTSITGHRVAAVLDRLADLRGLPEFITVDHVFAAWLAELRMMRRRAKRNFMQRIEVM